MVSTQEENAALVRAFLINVVASGDTDALGIFLSEDAVDRRPVLDNEVESEMVGSRYWKALAVTDIQITVDNVVAADENVAIRGTLARHHRESLHDRESNRRSFEIAIAWFCRIENGQIVETWSLPDGSWLVEQLDAIPGGT